MGASGSVLSTESHSPDSPLIRGQNSTVSTAVIKSISFTGVNTATIYPAFIVTLGFWPNKPIALPETFKLKVSYESLDFVRVEDESPIIQFPFQNIICWGSSQQNFQFKIFDFEKLNSVTSPMTTRNSKDNTETEEESATDPKIDNGILISLKTNQGRLIEDTTMSTVQKLMKDINQRAISKAEFHLLIENLFESDKQTLKENWFEIIQQFTAGERCLLAKQGMDLLVRIGSLAPFEKFDLACFLYDKIINKDSFQLLVNTFDDVIEKENLIHRLKLNKNPTNKKEVVKNCTIIPERVEF
eukprot:gene11750-15722_t